MPLIRPWVGVGVPVVPHTEKGWEIDHITPKARGGSDATVNLQALNTRLNRQKGDSLKKRSRHSQS